MKKQTAQIALRITLAAVTIALSAFLLVTCDGLFPPNGSEDGEYTDVIYSPSGSSITLYLRPDGMGDDVKPGPDTYGVPRTAEQRALSLELAKMGHDYFEAVFVSGSSIARAAWEIGTPAGISGVERGPNYGPVMSTFTTTGTVTTGTPAAVIFVGKKTGKTLLGIGHIVRVDATWDATTITPNSKSVTFGVYPLLTEVGFDNKATDPENDPPDWKLKPGLTFLTNAKATGGAVIDDTTTDGQNVTLAAGVAYPLFTLPVVNVNTFPTSTDPDDWPKILAKYTFGGMLEGDDPDFTPHPDIPPSPNGPNQTLKPDLLAAAILADKLEIIKRTPSFLYKGQTFDATGEVIDQYTKVVHTNNNAAGVAFANPITMTFTQTIQSTGIFAITFQVPVYAITPAPLDSNSQPDTSSNGAAPATKWYIRPGYNQYQYLLDDGEAAGGAVMLGSGVSGLDWLDIFTVGIGFSN